MSRVVNCEWYKNHGQFRTLLCSLSVNISYHVQLVNVYTGFPSYCPEIDKICSRLVINLIKLLFSSISPSACCNLNHNFDKSSHQRFSEIVCFLNYCTSFHKSYPLNCLTEWRSCFKRVSVCLSVCFNSLAASGACRWSVHSTISLKGYAGSLISTIKCE